MSIYPPRSPARWTSALANLFIALIVLLTILVPWATRGQSLPERVARTEVSVGDLQRRLESHLLISDLGFQRLTHVETAVNEMTWMLRGLGAAVIAAAVKSAAAGLKRPQL